MRPSSAEKLREMIREIIRTSVLPSSLVRRARSLVMETSIADAEPRDPRGGWAEFEAALQAGQTVGTGTGGVSSPPHIVARFFVDTVEVHSAVVVVVPRAGEYVLLPARVSRVPFEVYGVVHDLLHRKEAERGQLVVNVYLRGGEVK